jgi:geranylgeranyl reductase family protein
LHEEKTLVFLGVTSWIKFMPEQTFDIVIIGAGPAGSATAYYLAKQGLRVALLDKSDFPRDKTCGDGLTPRAVKVLKEMGALDKVAERAFRCNSITLRHSDAVKYKLGLTMPGLPDHILILPRFVLDDLLRQHAVEAGACFIPDVKVEDIRRETDGTVRVRAGGGSFQCGLSVIATGANTKLLGAVGLLNKTPPTNLAARVYFENIEELDDSILLFFDDVELPGYGWVFPTSPTTANIGCGVFFDSPTPQASQLRRLIETHPYLSRILKNAKQAGPIKGYPLRTDFSPSHSGNDWVLVVGEAVGLVNPITGEGIDYALESAQLAARAILAGWQGAASPAIQKQYRAALAKKFRYQLALNHLAQKVYFRGGMLGNLLKRGQKSEYLRQAIVDACFGAADPVVMFSPRTLWEVFGP